LNLSGCKGDSEPQEAILGKWELIAQGPNVNDIKPVEPNGSYSEYFSDGKMISFSFETNKSFEYTYKVDSKFLCRYFEYNHEQEYAEYEYNFRDNQLRLIYVRGSVPIEMIYGRPMVFIYRHKK
jgi:hypothetical protein